MSSVIINNVVTFMGPVPESIKKALGKLNYKDRELLLNTSRIGASISWPVGVLDFLKKGEYEIEDLRQEPGARKIGELKTELKGFQEEAIEKLVAKYQGYLESPTGSGKTMMALGVMSKLKVRTLFVTHRVSLARQVATTIYEELGIISGFVGEGERIERPEITVAVAQSIVRKPLKDSYGMIIADECHHLPTATLLRILCGYNAKRKYGMTATLSRSDDKAKLFPLLLGKHKVVVKIEDALELLNIPVVVQVRTGLGDAAQEFCDLNCKIQKGCKTKEERLDCEFFKAKMFMFLCGWVNQEKRNKLVTNHAKGLLDKGHHSICILANRKAHALKIAEVLSGQGVSVSTCVGKIKPYDLHEFHLFGGVLVGTEALMGEGVDLPELSALFLASPAAGRVKVRQRAGRLMRGSGKKLLIDYIDPDCYSERLWWSRRSIYKSMRFGFEQERALGGDG